MTCGQVPIRNGTQLPRAPAFGPVVVPPAGPERSRLHKGAAGGRSLLALILHCLLKYHGGAQHTPLLKCWLRSPWAHCLYSVFLCGYMKGFYLLPPVHLSWLHSEGWSACAGLATPPQQACGTCTINTVLINYGEKSLLAQEPRLAAYKVNALMLSFKRTFPSTQASREILWYLNPPSIQSPELTVLPLWALTTKIVVAKEGSESTARAWPSWVKFAQVLSGNVVAEPEMVCPVSLIDACSVKKAWPGPTERNRSCLTSATAMALSRECVGGGE